MGEITVKGMSASDGERHWLIPGEEMDDLEHRLRYGAPTKGDLLVAASIINQFSTLMQSEEIYGSKQFRENGVKFCRQALKIKESQE